METDRLLFLNPMELPLDFPTWSFLMEFPMEHVPAPNRLVRFSLHQLCLMILRPSYPAHSHTCKLCTKPNTQDLSIVPPQGRIALPPSPFHQLLSCRMTP